MQSRDSASCEEWCRGNLECDLQGHTLVSACIIEGVWLSTDWRGAPSRGKKLAPNKMCWLKPSQKKQNFWKKQVLNWRGLWVGILEAQGASSSNPCDLLHLPTPEIVINHATLAKQESFGYAVGAESLHCATNYKPRKQRRNTTRKHWQIIKAS